MGNAVGFKTQLAQRPLMGSTMSTSRLSSLECELKSANRPGMKTEPGEAIQETLLSKATST